MTNIGTEDHSMEKTQRIYARVAGFLFLWLIILGIAGLVITSRVIGSGPFAQTAKRVVASEHLYRAALSCGVVEAVSAALLAFALYATLRPVDELLARMAMYWRLGESFIGGVAMILGFVRLRLYSSPQSMATLGTDHSQALVGLVRDAEFAAYNIGATFFSLGSILFFYLFIKSKYIPRLLSVFGVVSSVIVTIVCFGSLILPEHAAKLQYGWAPMALAEVTTGLWLMIVAVKAPAGSNQQTTRPGDRPA